MAPTSRRGGERVHKKIRFFFLQLPTRAARTDSVAPDFRQVGEEASESPPPKPQRRQPHDEAGSVCTRRFKLFFPAAPSARSVHRFGSAGFRKSGDDKLERRLRRAHPRNPNGASLTTRRGAYVQEDSFIFFLQLPVRAARIDSVVPNFKNPATISWRGGFGEPTPETPTSPASRGGGEHARKNIRFSKRWAELPCFRTRCVDSSCTTTAPHPVRNFSPFAPLQPQSMPSWQRPRTYSDLWHEWQSAEMCREKDLPGRALEDEATNIVTVGAHRLRFSPVPPVRSRSRAIVL
jgi:hypothetical protein